MHITDKMKMNDCQFSIYCTDYGSGNSVLPKYMCSSKVLTIHFL